MSWHYKFFAPDKDSILIGLDAHMGQVDSDYLCELTTMMRKAVHNLANHEGIGWNVEAFGHVPDCQGDGCNFTFKVEPVNTTDNPFYKAGPRYKGRTKEGA